MRAHSAVRFFIVALSILAASSLTTFVSVQADRMLTPEDALNLSCLREAYPQVDRIETGPDQRRWLYLKDGRKLLYSGAASQPGSLKADIREAMAQSYPLEPERPETPVGYAPGRKRPYELLEALYGSEPAVVRSGLASASILGRKITLSAPAAAAFARAAARLEALAAADPVMKGFLVPDGGFAWRKIAGEDAMSAHSYGIALDIGAKKSPYWRWSRQMPHPMQKTYPAGIVAALEDEGFIWGGKWHEYDLMHFEYRPELICKARALRSRRVPGARTGSGAGLAR